MLNHTVMVHPKKEFLEKAKRFAEQLQIDIVTAKEVANYPTFLTIENNFLTVSISHSKGTEKIYTDFLGGKAAHRRQYGGGRQQLLSRAIGLHKEKNLTVCDISAGLGQDAFVFACLGAHVTMIERSPIVTALLQDGLERAQQSEQLQSLSWELIHTDSDSYLKNLPDNKRPQVIYFDPMFPERRKSALVKKEMRVLRHLVGQDHDAAELLKIALETAKNRVVVKRPRISDTISQITPHHQIIGKKNRFDIYL